MNVVSHKYPILNEPLMTIDPSVAGYQNVYKLMIGVIVPRPIAFVSTVSAVCTCEISKF